ncbi:MAG TPA: DNA-processing protein DprA [Anaerohalosphaeraceae bacterium]|nr:DNA-processing protein DprA [Anaerohalosphaeraceae bacterium]HOL89945.1 DNA-processing protein DprA [Anaerohalosphaeraceae bacterium]HPP56317.1 DNA-processing protein DprA [Anaerohalosphaeraceae bacterium]
MREEQPTTHSEGIENWLRLRHTEGVGPILFGRLLKHFGTFDRIFGASVHSLCQVEGIGPHTAERIARTRLLFDAQKEMQTAEAHGVRILHWDDPVYPPALKAVDDPPPVLYVKGTLQRSDSLAVAIVGSRHCTHYGVEQAERFARLLASAGLTIVSGLARGIDSAAHRGALSASGRTIAVQGCGLAHCFPPENKNLFDKIAEDGAVLSELPMTYEPLSENFPGRNRIIAGLSMGVIVVEAAPRSGALITAKAALEYNREVMAVPGRIDSPTSKGPHELIKQGARLVDSVEEIMDTLGIVGQGLKEHVHKKAEQAAQKVQTTLFDISQLNLSDSEQVVFAVLDKNPVHIEEIIASVEVPAGQVHAALISLQLKGIVKQLPGSVFVKRGS